ncbi:hypothetical protein ACROYT_G038588 [Oculina patagonica]
MVGLRLIQLAIVTLNILLVILFVVANTDFCASVFETQVDHALLYHDISKADVVDEFECQLKCIGNESCKSFNVHSSGSNSKIVCELNNKTRQMKPGDFKWKKGSTYYGSVQVSCIDDSHDRNVLKDAGHCHPGYKGERCQTQKLGLIPSSPAHSCYNIRQSGVSVGNGEYWIDPEQNGNPLKVYCDMTTDGGGWLLVANIVMNNSTPPSRWTAETSYRGISNYHNNLMGIKKSAMNELRTHLNFTQLRFQCSKQQGRTFHVTTVANSTGEAVVQYFSDQTNMRPSSCNSFQRLAGDNSQLAMQCEKWGREGSFHVGKWGHDQKTGETMMYNHAAFIAYNNRWLIFHGKWLCDDNDDENSFFAVSRGDFWKIYVR